MLRTALELDGPAAIRYPRGMAAPFVQPRTIEPLPVGRGVIVQEGRDVALVGIGTGVGIAVEAAALLEALRQLETLIGGERLDPRGGVFHRAERLADGDRGENAFDFTRIGQRMGCLVGKESEHVQSSGYFPSA